LGLGKEEYFPPLSKETKLKISMAHKDIPLSEEHKTIY
jgi:hypothetical protein